MQRLLEIDTYRLMALLALPVAQKLTPWIGQAELQLLERLTALEAEIESRESAHHFRFMAAQAYHELVERRIAELRERRIQGLQTLEEVTERRLAPAMNTCGSVSSRLESLSRRVERTTQLLSTRVDVSREKQNQRILASMNRRAEAQLRLQQTETVPACDEAGDQQGEHRGVASAGGFSLHAGIGIAPGRRRRVTWR
jgi:uncharacterized membrane-anchored protein